MDNMIRLDWTIFIQMANFLITLVVLNYLLIKPVREQIAARKALTSGYAADIEAFSSKASEKLSGYEAALAEARVQAGEARENIKAQGAAQEQEILHAAHTDAHAYLQSSRAQTAKEVQAAMKTLLSQVNDLAAKAGPRILG
jgi:F-type H+-transporting ATPase subunit b